MTVVGSSSSTNTYKWYDISSQSRVRQGVLFSPKRRYRDRVGWGIDSLFEDTLRSVPRFTSKARVDLHYWALSLTCFICVPLYSTSKQICRSSYVLGTHGESDALKAFVLQHSFIIAVRLAMRTNWAGRVLSVFIKRVLIFSAEMLRRCGLWWRPSQLH